MKKCTICKEQIKGYGNNAEPIKEGICCGQCNDLFVIPARLKQLFPSKITKEEKQKIKELLKSGESVSLCNETDIFYLIRGYNNSFCLIKNGKGIKSTKTIAPIFAALEKENNLTITN